MILTDWFSRQLLTMTTGALLFLPAAFAKAADINDVPKVVLNRISSGMSQDIIVLYDDRDIEEEADVSRNNAAKKYHDEKIIARRAERYRLRKQQADAGLIGDGETVEDYGHLPMTLKRFRTRKGIDQIISNPLVRAVYENRPIYPHLTYSLPFIGQPTVANAGITGSGSTVAVIDTGVNYTLPAFGSCTAPGVPSGCLISASVDVTGNNVTLNTDAKGHGTNVAGVVTGLAPGARIAAINAFYNGESTISWIIAGINWAIGNKATYNIVAVNMSLGDGTNNTALCGNIYMNPFIIPINVLMGAGIIPVASSGNNGYTSGIASPACTPGVVSVGAVYDTNWGGPYTWNSGCTDSSSAADKIPCFSNSASFMTMLAPGAFITAAGIQMAGTSQAAPHVAGAVAVLQALYPGDTLDQTVARLTSGGVSVIDSRNSLVKPRLNLLATISPPANDMFTNRTILSGDTGQITASNFNAGKETGEPSHAGNPGGKSVWWSWTPAETGVVSLDTHGGNFNTLLAVYTGSGITGLSMVAANDNDGSSNNTSGLSFTAQAGTEYLIAVDGFNAATGQLKLNYSFGRQADLGVSMNAGPDPALIGEEITYNITVVNNGPSDAPNTVVTDTLPANSSLVSASAGCSLLSSTVSCDLGTVAVNAAIQLQITVTPAISGSLDNTATISSDVTDPVSANNSASISTSVIEPEPLPALAVWPLAAVFLLLLGAVRSSRKSCG